MIEALLGDILDVGPLVYVLVAGVLATASWRLLGVAAISKIPLDHPAIEWARMVAVAIVAGQAAILVVNPMGGLADLPVWQRIGAVFLGFGVYHFNGRSVLLGVAAGDAAVLTALALHGS